MCAQCEWMSKHGLAQGNCKNPRQRVLHNLRLFQQNTPVPQQGWFTDKLRISTKRHRRRATHIKSRLILSDIHQKATIKSFWWMSDVKKGEKGKQNLGFVCLHVNVSPLIVFQRWVFSDLKCCLHVDERPQPISTNTFAEIPMYTWSYV